jgi:hypothetical protein
MAPRARVGAEEAGAAGRLSRGDLAARTEQVLHRGSRRNPDVLLVRSDAGSIVVKDFAPRGALVRATIGPWLTSREVRAYQALAGHPAVPRFLYRIDAIAFAVEYRPGRRMSRKLAGELRPDFFEALRAAVRGLHQRGVAHLDLRHRSNVLADAEGRPVLIDFASAVCFRPGALAARRVLPLLARFDLRALEKWRERLLPQETRSDGRRGARRPTK